MLEVIEISNAIEQDLIVSYGDRIITYEIRWNDILNYWYINVKENNAYIASGISCTAINSNLLYDRLNLGKLYMVDTEIGTNTSPIVKTDLGKRLALMREYA